MAHEIVLIRHGETDSNAARVVQTPDAPLSSRGREQARRLGRRLATEGIDRVVASDLVRARSTAEELARATGAALHVEPLLAERNYGDLRGTAYADLGDRDIFAWEFEPPGGESGSAFDARVDAAWRAILSHADQVAGRLAVVTHGLVCASLVLRYFSLAELTVGGSFGNASVTLVEGRPPWRVLLLDCRAHLADPDEGGAVV